jgi:two-component system capsular synthesis response regulator RcsB
MNLEHSIQHLGAGLTRQNACDDTPLSHGHLPPMPLRIILADDHPVVLTGVEMTLCQPPESAFLIVAQAQNADELIAHLEQTPCHLLISDYSMPYGRFPDGLALMGYIKRHYGHIPLIVMTMLRNPSLLQALLNTGVNGLFDKRSPMGELKRAVNTVIRGRRHLCPSFAGIIKAQNLPSTGTDAPSVSLRFQSVIRRPLAAWVPASPKATTIETYRSNTAQKHQQQ